MSMTSSMILTILLAQPPTKTKERFTGRGFPSASRIIFEGDELRLGGLVGGLIGLVEGEYRPTPPFCLTGESNKLGTLNPCKTWLCVCVVVSGDIGSSSELPPMMGEGIEDIWPMPLTSISFGARRGDEVRGWCGGGCGRGELEGREWRGGSRTGYCDVISEE